MGVKVLTVRSNSVGDYLGSVRQLQTLVNAKAQGSTPPRVSTIIPEGEEHVVRCLEDWGVEVTNNMVTLISIASAKYDKLMDDVSNQLREEAA